MLRYRIIHETEYSYSDAVSLCQNQVVLKPAETPWLRCRHHRLTVRPTGSSITHHFDYFRNIVQSFAIEKPHRQLLVRADSTVEVQPCPMPEAPVTRPWRESVRAIVDGTDPHWFEAVEYVFDSPMVRRGDVFGDYARQSAEPADTLFTLCAKLNSRIHADFQYDTGASEVTTAPEQAMESRRGVCQDFAHVQIACLRSLGIPVRYVSGYLRTVPAPGKPRLIGADQSHAWVSAYCGPDYGWVEFDPTNNCRCGTDHIALARGRDYQDVAPVRGVMLGGGSHQLRVSVDVEIVQ